MAVVSEDSVRLEVARVSRLARAEVRRGAQALTDSTFAGDKDLTTKQRGSHDRRPHSVGDIVDILGAANGIRSPISPSLGSKALVIENEGFLVAEPQHAVLPTASIGVSVTASVPLRVADIPGVTRAETVVVQQSSLACSEMSNSTEITMDGAGSLVAAAADRLRARAGAPEQAGASAAVRQTAPSRAERQDPQLDKILRAGPAVAAQADAALGEQVRELSKLLNAESAAASRSQTEAQALRYERDAALTEVHALCAMQPSEEAQDLSMRLATESASAASRRDEAQVLLYEYDAAQAEVQLLRSRQFSSEDQQSSSLSSVLLQAQLKTCELKEGAATERCLLIEGWLQGAALEAREALSMARQMATSEVACLAEVATASDERNAALEELRALRTTWRTAESSGSAALYKEAREEAEAARRWREEVFEMQSMEAAMRESVRTVQATNEARIAELQTELRSAESCEQLQATPTSEL